jgi:hypothetical protein
MLFSLFNSSSRKSKRTILDAHVSWGWSNSRSNSLDCSIITPSVVSPVIFELFFFLITFLKSFFYPEIFRFIKNIYYKMRKINSHYFSVFQITVGEKLNGKLRKQNVILNEVGTLRRTTQTEVSRMYEKN